MRIIFWWKPHTENIFNGDSLVGPWLPGEKLDWWMRLSSWTYLQDQGKWSVIKEFCKKIRYLSLISQTYQFYLVIFNIREFWGPQMFNSCSRKVNNFMCEQGT